MDLPSGGIEDSPAQSTEYNGAIPGTLIQTWEENNFGRRHRRSLLNFRSNNPDVNFILLDSMARDKFMREIEDQELSRIYFRSIFRPMQVDIFRYAYLMANGGYYCDISLGFSERILDLAPPSCTALMTQEGNEHAFSPSTGAFNHLPFPMNLMAIWFFGFTPGHPILKLVLEQIKKDAPLFEGRVFELPKNAILTLTGPRAFTRAVFAHLMNGADSTMFVAGKDVNGTSYTHSGAGYRHLKYPSYAQARNSRLFLA